MVNRELALHFALRSDDNVEVGILGGDIVVRRAGWLARMLRESCPSWLQEVLLVAEPRLPMGLATVRFTGRHSGSGSEQGLKHVDRGRRRVVAGNRPAELCR
jgi:hypothetical protein